MIFFIWIFTVHRFVFWWLNNLSGIKFHLNHTAFTAWISILCQNEIWVICCINLLYQTSIEGIPQNIKENSCVEFSVWCINKQKNLKNCKFNVILNILAHLIFHFIFQPNQSLLKITQKIIKFPKSFSREKIPRSSIIQSNR